MKKITRQLGAASFLLSIASFSPAAVANSGVCSSGRCTNIYFTEVNVTPAGFGVRFVDGTGADVDLTTTGHCSTGNATSGAIVDTNIRFDMLYTSAMASLVTQSPVSIYLENTPSDGCTIRDIAVYFEEQP